MKNMNEVNIIETFKPFGIRTTAHELASKLSKEEDLTGRVFAITGTSLWSLGYEVAKALLDQNAELILLDWSKEPLKAAADELRKNQTKHSKGKLYEVVCDLSKQKSVKSAVSEIKGILDQKQLKLDTIICSAGRYFKERLISEDGYEMTMAIDHYGHFALVVQLLERMKENGRVVMLSSNQQTKVNAFPLDDLKFEKEDYAWLTAHPRAKLANLMFSHELNNRLEKSGSKIVSYAIYPGAAKTNFSMEEGFILKQILNFSNKFFGLSREQAAATTTFAALEPRLEGRRKLFLSQCGISDETNPLADDQKLISDFFDHSLEATKIKFPI